MHLGKEGRKEGNVAQRFVGAVIPAHLASATVTQSWSREVAVVSGGSVDDLSTDPAVNVTWNNYEALVVTAFEIGYGQKHRLQCNALPLGVALQKGVLIAPGACTHHSDMHQRYVGLASEPGAPNEVVITTPPSDKHAPRGIYMLFLLTNHGSVSHAVWVVLQ